MKKLMLPLMAILAVALMVGCASIKTEGERAGYDVKITVEPDYPVAGFPAVVKVSVLGPGGGVLKVGIEDVEMKLLSENFTQMEELRPKPGAEPGTYAAEAKFNFGGPNNLLFTGRVGGTRLTKHEIITVGGPYDPGHGD